MQNSEKNFRDECSELLTQRGLKTITSDSLIALFNSEFLETHNTELVGGSPEPEYKPLNRDYPHNRIIFTRDYCASALHEIAHWCVAGKARLQLVDYGYWYIPDGRNAQQQAQFEQVEVKPQALEWIFANACGLPFRISADNIDGPVESQQGSQVFKQNVVDQARRYCLDGVNNRAKRWVERLQIYFNQQDALLAERYCLSALA